MRYSPVNRFDEQPSTQAIFFNDTITGIASIQNFVIVFTKNDMHFVVESFLRQTKKNKGCWSHDSIVSENSLLYWANRAGVQLWTGAQVVDISTAAIGDKWKGLSNASIEDAQGFLNIEHREYYITLDIANVTYVYHIPSLQWRTRDLDFNDIGNDPDGNIVAADNTNFSGIFDVLDGSILYDDQIYLCNALSKTFKLDKDHKFELLRLWLRSAHGQTLFMDFIRDGSVIRTITFPGESDVVTVKKSLAGYGGLPSFIAQEMSINFRFSSATIIDSIDSLQFEFTPISLL
jgi:hypothetical protein